MLTIMTRKELATISSPLDSSHPKLIFPGQPFLAGDRRPHLKLRSLQSPQLGHSRGNWTVSLACLYFSPLCRCSSSSRSRTSSLSAPTWWRTLPPPSTRSHMSRWSLVSDTYPRIRVAFRYIWTLNNLLISDVQGLEDEIRPAPGQNEVGHAMKSFKIIVPLNIWFVGSWFSLLFPSGTAVAWSQWTPCWELEHLGPKLGGSGGMIASLMRSGLNFWLVHNDRRGIGALKVYICP